MTAGASHWALAQAPTLKTLTDLQESGWGQFLFGGWVNNLFGEIGWGKEEGGSFTSKRRWKDDGWGGVGISRFVTSRGWRENF